MLRNADVIKTHTKTLEMLKLILEMQSVCRKTWPKLWHEHAHLNTLLS